jgi:hypothetical protein
LPRDTSSQRGRKRIFWAILTYVPEERAIQEEERCREEEKLGKWRT